MIDILKKIVATKKQEVENSIKSIPLKIIREKAEKKQKVRHFSAGFIKAKGKQAGIIAEIKRASPSRGWINKDMDAKARAVLYEKGGACAISVLTDHKYFKGKPEDLVMAREAVGLPVLRKDFVISSYQIYEARAMGADAVLLIAAILEERQLQDYLGLVHELGMEALVETHTFEELDTALRSGAKIVGINNRNLKTFETDITIAAKMAKEIGPDRTGISESGIKGRDDIETLMESGIYNFLIGETLVRAKDPEKLLHQLATGESSFCDR